MAFTITVTPGAQVGNTTTIDAGTLNLLASPTVGVTGQTTDLGNWSSAAPTDTQLLSYVTATSKWTPTSTVPATFLGVFTGATASDAGAKGAVPQPSAGQQTYFLSGNGTWQPLPINTADAYFQYQQLV